MNDVVKISLLESLVPNPGGHKVRDDDEIHLIVVFRIVGQDL